MADLEGEQRRFLRKAIFAVENMHCTACSVSVESTLRHSPAVVVAQASALHHSAEATYDSREVDAAALVTLLDKAGFPSSITKDEALEPSTQFARFRIEGMTCSTCSGAVESALAGNAGVKHASVSLTLQEARVEYNPDETNEVRTTAEAPPWVQPHWCRRSLCQPRLKVVLLVSFPFETLTTQW